MTHTTFRGSASMNPGASLTYRRISDSGIDIAMEFKGLLNTDHPNTDHPNRPLVHPRGLQHSGQMNSSKG